MPRSFLSKTLRNSGAAALLLSLSACGFVRDDHLVGPYWAVAVDIDEDMSLCWKLKSGDCDTLAGPTLFAAGYDDRYVAAAIHPERNRSATQFFYVVRDNALEQSDDGSFKIVVKGPFSAQAYGAEKTRLHLPDFSYKADAQ